MTSRRALTLVEVILTIVLASILGIPTGLLIAEHLNIGIRSRDSVLATQLARNEMERLDAPNDFFASTLTPGSPVIITNYQGFPYTMTRSVVCLAGDCASAVTSTFGVKQVTVTITKPDTGATLARLITYRTKHVAFGM